jgi:hypothetical protein
MEIDNLSNIMKVISQTENEEYEPIMAYSEAYGGERA